MSMLKLCLRKAPVKKNRPMKYNIPRLKKNEVLKVFVVEIKNQSQLLNTELIDHPQVEGKWNQIKDIYCNTVKDTLWLQTTQLTIGGAVTADSSCCANCVKPPRPQGYAGHADPLDGGRCCSQKRMMSRPIQVRQF